MAGGCGTGDHQADVVAPSLPSTWRSNPVAPAAPACRFSRRNSTPLADCRNSSARHRAPFRRAFRATNTARTDEKCAQPPNPGLADQQDHRRFQRQHLLQLLFSSAITAPVPLDRFSSAARTPPLRPLLHRRQQLPATHRLFQKIHRTDVVASTAVSTGAVAGHHHHRHGQAGPLLAHSRSR